MPKKARSNDEINRRKEDILNHALDIIREDGYGGFSMRKLSSRLGVSVVTLYRFYESKDHIYLAVLTNGYQLLYQELLRAYKSGKNPEARLRSIADAYLRFGITQANFYNLMFTWHAPKYQDYVGTPMEEAAKNELDESQKVYLFAIQAAKELVESTGNVKITDDRLRSYVIHFWITLHGYTAGVNNNLLNYMHEDPLSLRKNIIDGLFKYMNIVIEENRNKTRKNNNLKKKRC
jgi:AcrR family transcriptional regulator